MAMHKLLRSGITLGFLAGAGVVSAATSYWIATPLEPYDPPVIALPDIQLKSATMHDFGVGRYVGRSYSHTWLIENEGKASGPLSLVELSTSGNVSVSSTCGAELAPSESCSLSVTWAPQDLESTTGSFLVNGQKISWTGNAPYLTSTTDLSRLFALDGNWFLSSHGWVNNTSNMHNLVFTPVKSGVVDLANIRTIRVWMTGYYNSPANGLGNSLLSVGVDTEQWQFGINDAWTDGPTGQNIIEKNSSVLSRTQSNFVNRLFEIHIPPGSVVNSLGVNSSIFPGYPYSSRGISRIEIDYAD